MELHSAKASRYVAVALTMTIGIFFSFLASWTLYDVFASWGVYPAVTIGVIVGIVFLLLHLYVFVLREYAVDAIEFFSDRRYEEAKKRLRYGMFLIIAVILVESSFNADRMIVLALQNTTAKWIIWMGLQVLVFVPFALGKVVHAHVNASRTPIAQVTSFAQSVDEQYYSQMRKSLKSMPMDQLHQLHRGETKPLDRVVSTPEEKTKEVHPLVSKLHDPNESWGEGRIVGVNTNGSSNRASQK